MLNSNNMPYCGVCVLQLLTSREFWKWCLPKICSMGRPLLCCRLDILSYRYSVMAATCDWIALMPPRRSIMPKPCCRTANHTHTHNRGHSSICYCV